MLDLTYIEAASVVGGGNAASKVADACKGLPDSTNVTITTSHTGELGGAVKGLGGSVSATTSDSLSVNCGDFRKAQSKSGGSTHSSK